MSEVEPQNQSRRKFILFVGNNQEICCFIYINKIIFSLSGNLTFDTTEDDLKKFFEDTSKF